MKRVTLIISFLLLTTTVTAQQADSVTSASLSAWLAKNYNISELNEKFYECVAQNESSYTGKTRITEHCLDFISMRGAKYSDAGLKAVSLFKAPWLKMCSFTYKDIGIGISAPDYCACLFDTYQEKSMGMEEILSAEFQKSDTNKGFMKSCREKSEID